MCCVIQECFVRVRPARGVVGFRDWAKADTGVVAVTRETARGGWRASCGPLPRPRFEIKKHASPRAAPRLSILLPIRFCQSRIGAQRQCMCSNVAWNARLATLDAKISGRRSICCPYAARAHMRRQRCDAFDGRCARCKTHRLVQRVPHCSRGRGASARLAHARRRRRDPRPTPSPRR